MAKADTKEETKAEDTSAVTDTKDQAPKKETKSEETKTIADEETAKAAVPELQDEKAAFPWWIILLAAAAGITVEEYVRRRNSKDKKNESNDNITK